MKLRLGIFSIKLKTVYTDKIAMTYNTYRLEGKRMTKDRSPMSHILIDFLTNSN